MIMGHWDSAAYIASQVLTITAFALLASTYFIVRRKKLLATTIALNISFGVAYALLGGWVGVGMMVVATMRDTVSNAIYHHRKPRDKGKILPADWWWLALWIFLQSAIAAATFDGLSSLWALAGSVIFTVSIWQKNGVIYRILGILSCVAWIAYSLYLSSAAGVVLNALVIASAARGLAAYQNRARRVMKARGRGRKKR